MEKQDFIKAKQLLHNSMGISKEELGKMIKDAVELTARNLLSNQFPNEESVDKNIEKIVDRVVTEKINDIISNRRYGYSDEPLKDRIARKVAEKIDVNITFKK